LRLLPLGSSDELVGRGLELALLAFLLLLPVVSLGAPGGAHGIVDLLLPLVLVTTKDCTNRLLAGDKVGDDVHQPVGSEWSVTAQLSDQLLAGGAGEEGHNHVGVGDVGELGTLPGEAPDVIPEGFTRFLLATPEVPRVAGAHVGPIKISLEHPHKIVPVVDLSRWEILEPGSGGVGEEQGELPNDDPVVGGPAQLTRQAEIGEPKFRFGFAVVLGESRGRAKPSREHRLTDSLAEDPRARRLG
jgi:hypothetical protein